MTEFNLKGRFCITIIIFLALIFVIIPFILREHIVQAYKIPASSMMPTLMVGDHILVDKTVSPHELKRGDVIVFIYPKDSRKDFVKRIIGVPGDIVEMNNNELYINNKLQQEDYVLKGNGAGYGTDFKPVRVPPECFFVLGDNRANSLDSRFWGFVEFSKIRGKVKRIYWSWDRQGSSLRKDRLWMEVL